MRLSNKHILLGSGALASLLLSASLVSCQDEDFGHTTEEVRAAVYARNFEKMYGKISENQTWDFSTYNLYNMGLSGGASVDAETRSFISTRANSAISDNFYGDYEISSVTTEWLNEHMEEKKDNSGQVMSFSLKAEDVFYILPIYQGQSGMIWDLKLEDETNSYTIWHKSDGFKFTTDYTLWEEFHYQSGSHTANWDRNNNSALRLNNAFENMPSSVGTNDDVSIVFSIPKKEVSKDNYEDQTIKGHFILQYEDSDNKTKYYNITGNDLGYTSNTTNKGKCDTNGWFTFSSENNPTISDGDLSKHNNEVDLKPLLNKTFNDNGNSVSVDSKFSNLIFVIDKDTYNKDYNFYTWTKNRIRVFVKYPFTGTEESMTHNANDAYMKAHTISKNHLKTQLIKINNQNINGVFNFNLETNYLSSGDKGLSTIGEAHRSNDIPGMMRAITVFNSTNDIIDKDALRDKLNRIIGFNTGDYNELPSDFKYMVLGCEDARGGGLNADGEIATTDWDYNDIVFLVVGKQLPYIYEGTVEKRYMIEDLGSTFDFDFNDIVVDVKEEHVRDLSDPYKYDFKQTAKIQFLCGTIPFQISLGGKQIGDGPMLGHNGSDEKGIIPSGNAYSWTFEQKGIDVSDVTKAVLEESYANIRATNKLWDPVTNNIKVRVWPKAGTDGKGNDVYWYGSGTAADNLNGDKPVNVDDIPLDYNDVLFPKNGEYPYIIATDPTVNWMPELHSIPEYWLQTKPLTAWGVDYDGPSGWNDQNHSIPVTIGQAILPSFTYPESGWTYKAIIEKDQFGDIANGDKIILSISNVLSSNGVTLTVRNNGWTEKIKGNGSNSNGYFSATTEQTTIVIEPTDEDITNLKTYGIAIQGYGFTLRQVDIEKKPAAPNPVLDVDVPAALGNSISYTVTPKNDSGIDFPRIYITGLTNYNGYDDILVTVANPSSEKDITAQVIGGSATGNKTITSGNYFTYELTNQSFKNAYQNKTLFLETYYGNDLFTRNDGQKAQIYVTTRIVVKEVEVPDNLGQEYEYYHTAAGSPGNDSNNPRVYLDASLNNYNGYDDILVTVANRSNTSMTAQVKVAGGASTGNQSIASGNYYTFTLTADAYKQAMKEDNKYIYLEASVGGDKLNRSVADAAKIYVTTRTADVVNMTPQEVFGSDSWWQASNAQYGNFGVMFNGKNLDVKPDQYKLKVYYTTSHDNEFYGICQSNGGDWWRNTIANGDNKSRDSNGNYIECTLTKTIIDNINVNNRPLYLNTAENGNYDLKVTDVKLVKNAQ